ncbi:uncharacterized protein [Parasteatoda tepidariorum]|uniref:uncharacterized protein n=1 Tax=Parasteatoda tepidariorum TaxID=114398 RepID=UPI000A2C01BF|nr:uncharacterized protein LOC107440209 [Parasteatoda tepidariorum]
MNILHFFGVLFFLKVVSGLRLARLDVPAAVVRGEAAWLNCTYNLENDELYSVKWYKNNVEFYRFLPSDRPPGQKYDLQGVYVDLAQSALGHVYLQRTDLNTEGVYRCEVSAEAPSFQTVREEKEVRVYVLPEDGPTISGVKPQYQVGDDVNVTCSAGPSKPAAALRWYINGHEAPLEYEIRYSPIRHPDRLLVSTLGLRFTAEPRHFWHGAMKLRCSAVISQAYSMSSEEIIVGDNAKASAVVGDGPVITGGKPKYQKGDTVDVNCTSAKSNPPAELKWYINDKPVRQEFLIRYKPVRYQDGQATSILGLSFPVRTDHFQRDEMRLKCTATLSKVINMSSEETLVGSSQQSSGLHISENTGAVINRGSTVGCLLQTLFVSTFLAALL